MMHSHDMNCTVDPDTMLCIYCGVDHSRECPDCHHRGFHSDTCFLWEPSWNDGEPDHDDTVRCCPDCERPNQFGERCTACERDIQIGIAENRL